jgi:hypothetical protein
MQPNQSGYMPQNQPGYMPQTQPVYMPQGNQQQIYMPPNQPTQVFNAKGNAQYPGQPPVQMNENTQFIPNQVLLLTYNTVVSVYKDR